MAANTTGALATTNRERHNTYGRSAVLAMAGVLADANRWLHCPARVAMYGSDMVGNDHAWMYCYCKLDIKNIILLH